MAWVTLPGGLMVPAPQWGGSTPTFQTAQLNSSADRMACVYRALEDLTITNLALSIGNVSTAAALDLRVETVNTADRLPSGTLWATNTFGTTGSPSANTVVTAALTANASITRGQVFALVAQSNTTPINVTPRGYSPAQISSSARGFPYACANTSGTYDPSATCVFCFGLKSGGVWKWTGFDSYPATTETFSTFSTSTGATTGTRRGLRFKVPYAAKMDGCWYNGFYTAAASDFTIALYDTGGTLLATLASVEGAHVVAQNTGELFFIAFDSVYTLVADTAYRLVLIPSSTNSIGLYETATSSNDYFGGLSPGIEFYLTKYVSSAWSDVTTERPWMGIHLSAIDDGTGSGSGSSAVASFGF